MNTYTYQAPYVKGGTTKCYIYNSNDQIVGAIQRYYKSFILGIIDAWIGSNELIVNYKAYNSKDEEVIKANKKTYMTKKSDFYIDFISKESNSKFHARQQNLDVFNAEYKIKSGNLELYSSKSVADWVRFKENGNEVARWKYKLTKKFKTYMEIEEYATIQSPEFYALLGQMLYFVGD